MADMANVIDKMVDAGTKRSENLPHIAELFEAIIRRFGGMDNFAQKVFDCYENSKEGSQQQARLLTSLLQGLQSLTDKGYIGGGEDESLMSEDEIKDEIARMVKEADGGQAQGSA